MHLSCTHGLICKGEHWRQYFSKWIRQSVTVRWQGKEVPLPLANLNPASQALARSLARVSSPPAKAVVKPVAPEKDRSCFRSPGHRGELSLDSEYEWKNTAGSVLKAKFISVEGDTLNLSMYGGRSEQSIPLERMAKESQDLAKKLQALFSEASKKAKGLFNQKKKYESADFK